MVTESAVLFMMLALGGGRPATETPRYRMFDLGPGRLGREAGLKCNSIGWVLGSSYNGPWSFWRPGIGWSQMPTYPGYRHTEARVLNDRGEIGCQLMNGGLNDAGIWDATDGLRKISMPKGFNFLRAFGINSHGEIVGVMRTFEGFEHAWYYKNGTIATDLGFARPDAGTNARDINDNGDIVGWHQSDTVTPTAHMWLARTRLVILGHPASGGVWTMDLNNPGDIALQPGVLSEIEDVRWSDGTWQALPPIPGTAQNWAAYAINDSRTIVGGAKLNGTNRGVFWTPALGTRLVQDFVDSSADGYTIGYIYDVSNNGLMCGEARKPGDQYRRPVLLVPYPRQSSGG